MLIVHKSLLVTLCVLIVVLSEGFAAGKLYWTDPTQGALMRSDLDGGARERFLGGLQAPVGIAIDEQQRYIYWSDLAARAIKRSPLSDVIVPEPEISIVHEQLSQPSALAIDPLERTLYWADPVADRIERSALDGSARETILDREQGLASPQSIAIDINERKLYWADNGTQRIQRSNLDGSAVETLIEGARDPAGITVDSHSGHIYWTERASNTIYRARLDGTDRREIATAAAPKAILFDDDSGLLFWANSRPASLSVLGSQFVDQGGLNARALVIDHSMQQKVHASKHPNVLWKFIFDSTRRPEYTESAEK